MNSISREFEIKVKMGTKQTKNEERQIESMGLYNNIVLKDAVI